MFKMILSAIVAIGFSSFAFAQEGAAPAGGEKKMDAPAAEAPAAEKKMEGKKMDHKGGEHKHGKKKKKEEAK